MFSLFTQRLMHLPLSGVLIERCRFVIILKREYRRRVTAITPVGLLIFIIDNAGLSGF